MSILVILIPLALLLGFIGLLAFLWALKDGQFDDPDGAAARILSDDGPLADPQANPPRPPKKAAKKNRRTSA